MYVNQHDYFITQERVQEGTEIIENSMSVRLSAIPIRVPNACHRWEALPNPETAPPKNEPRLAKLYGELNDKVSEEASIIQAVFPNPPLVMQVFLQRVFAQVVRRVKKLVPRGSLM